jgi:hypothetical protein
MCRASLCACRAHYVQPLCDTLNVRLWCAGADQIGFVSQFAIEAPSAATPRLLRLTPFLGPLSKAHPGTPAVFLNKLNPGCF